MGFVIEKNDVRPSLKGQRGTWGRFPYLTDGLFFLRRLI